jgi:hypothetical protein
MPSGIDITIPQNGFPCRVSGVEYEGEIKKAVMSRYGDTTALLR